MWTFLVVLGQTTTPRTMDEILGEGERPYCELLPLK